MEKQTRNINPDYNGSRRAIIKHISTLQPGREKKNSIKRLLNDRGEWCTNLADITDIAMNYFSKHL